LQGLCCLDVQGEKGRDLVDEFLAASKDEAEVAASARRLLTEALADRPRCDELLGRTARRWQLGRLALVDRNILRLAVCELRAGRQPMKVIISEAMKLAEEFSTAESARFINGVLDSIAKEIAGEISPGTPDNEKDG